MKDIAYWLSRAKPGDKRIIRIDENMVVVKVTQTRRGLINRDNVRVWLRPVSFLPNGPPGRLVFDSTFADSDSGLSLV